VLSDREQRALEELERSFAQEEPGRAPSGRAWRRHGRRWRSPLSSVLAMGLGCLSVALLWAGVPVAGLALALATVITWLFWRVWVHRADVGVVTTSLLLGVGRGPSGPDRRPGDSIRRYLRWLAEAE
jgi:hypothetical protein